MNIKHWSISTPRYFICGVDFLRLVSHPLRGSYFSPLAWWLYFSMRLLLLAISYTILLGLPWLIVVCHYVRGFGGSCFPMSSAYNIKNPLGALHSRVLSFWILARRTIFCLMLLRRLVKSFWWLGYGLVCNLLVLLVLVCMCCSVKWRFLKSYFSSGIILSFSVSVVSLVAITLYIIWFIDGSRLILRELLVLVFGIMTTLASFYLLACRSLKMWC